MVISCPACDNSERIDTVSGTKQITVRGEPVKFSMAFRKCTKCGEEFVVTGVDDDPLDKAYREYRKKHSFLQPEEIVDFRKKYHITQGELAALLGLGTATLSRYENGKLQNETHDKLLRLSMDCESLRRLVLDSRNVFADKKKAVVLDAIDKNTAQMGDCLGRFIVLNLEDRDVDEYRGFKRFDIAKFRNSVLFFCEEGVVKTKLNKLLFYADFLHFKDYTLSITGAQYARVPFGPAPNNYNLYYETLVRDSSVEMKEVECGPYSGDSYRARAEPNLNIFAPSELRILASVKECFKDWNANQMSKISHEEKGYKETQTGKRISYLYAQNLQLNLIKQTCEHTEG